MGRALIPMRERPGRQKKEIAKMAALSNNGLTDQKLENMFQRIARSDVVIKSQQKDEPDLTEEEKLCILWDIFKKNPCNFLMRFGKSFDHEDLNCFDGLKGNYEIDFYLKQIKQYLDERKRKTGITNRRYECMQRLAKESDFFSDEEMRKRCPWMYEQYVGQYLTEQEKFDRDQAQLGSDPSLKEFLFNCMDRDVTKFMCEYQKEYEESQQEEEEDDDDEGSGSDAEEEISGSPFKGVPNEAEKQMLKEEFKHIMQERFIQGEDGDFFDYSTVDTNEDFDDLQVRGQDEEDAYFDDEEPSACNMCDDLDSVIEKEKKV